MKKHIKVSAKYNRDGETFTLTVKEMTHPSVFDFGGGQSEVTSEYRVKMFVHGNTLLAFNGLTGFGDSEFTLRAWSAPKEVTKVFVLNSQESENTMTLPVKYWPDLREAIKAYNEFYSE